MPLSSAVKDTVKAHPSVYRVLRGLREGVGNLLPPRRVADIPGRVHWNDLMFDGAASDGANDYRSTGLQAVEFMDSALTINGRSLAAVKTVLDFGCGYGRVLRFLAQRTSAGAVTACDVDARAVAFSAQEFRARPLRADPDIGSVHFEEYELIWVGSVLTHVDAATGATLLSVLGSHLARSGLLVFSTHGTYSLEHLQRFGSYVPRLENKIRRDLSSSGIAFAAYPHYGSNEYGLTWHDPRSVPGLPAAAGLRMDLVLSRLNHWGAGRQDLWAFCVR
jgi:SAM-dependent methyltransferase